MIVKSWGKVRIVEVAMCVDNWRTIVVLFNKTNKHSQAILKLLAVFPSPNVLNIYHRGNVLPCAVGLLPKPTKLSHCRTARGEIMVNTHLKWCLCACWALYR